VYRRFLLHYATLRVLRIGLVVLGDDVYTFYQYTAFLRIYCQHTAWLSTILIITGYNDYVIALPDIKLWFKSVFHNSYELTVVLIHPKNGLQRYNFIL
jgi:hypothetical protein